MIRALRLALVAPLLVVIMLLVTAAVSLWNTVSWLSQFPDWVIAMTVVLSLLAALCLAMAVRSW